MQPDPLKLADRVAAWILRSDISPSMVSTPEIDLIVRALRERGTPTPEVPGTSAASYLLGKEADATYRALWSASEALGAILPENHVGLLQDIAAAVSLLSHARSAARREVTEPNDDGMKDDLDAALDALIRRINGEADLPSAAKWVRLNYPSRAKELRPVDVVADMGIPISEQPQGVAAADATARVKQAISDIPVLGGNIDYGEVLGEVDVGRIAFHALRALRPGDVVPAGVVVPAEQAEHCRRILDGIDQWVRAEMETSYD